MKGLTVGLVDTAIVVFTACGIGATIGHHHPRLALWCGIGLAAAYLKIKGDEQDEADNAQAHEHDE